MIPEFTSDGFLCPGRHRTVWSEYVQRYGYGEHRQYLLRGQQQMFNLVGFAGCSLVLIGGSFVTAKPVPGNFDGVWMKDGVDMNELPLEIAVAELAMDARKDIFGGTLASSRAHFWETGLFMKSLEKNRRGQPVGVIVLDPREVPLAEPFERYVEHFARATASG